ncbi:hypothetical protein [Saccharopolyspora sp. NPDC002578]
MAGRRADVSWRSRAAVESVAAAHETLPRARTPHPIRADCAHRPDRAHVELIRSPASR